MKFRIEVRDERGGWTASFGDCLIYDSVDEAKRVIDEVIRMSRDCRKYYNYRIVQSMKRVVMDTIEFEDHTEYCLMELDEDNFVLRMEFFLTLWGLSEARKRWKST